MPISARRERPRTTARRLPVGASAPILLVLAVAGCEGTGPAEPSPPDAGDPDHGLVAFRESCASCHASRDGFDLAFFDFPDEDIVRRAVDHVDSATARDIAAYVETLEVEPVGRDFRAFQPGDDVLDTDRDFWSAIFGTLQWPDDGSITVEWLRNLDLRDVAVPLPFPLWSSEEDESDWMPEGPLPASVLDAEGGAVRSALDAYYAAPSDERMLDVIRAFRRVTGNASEAESPVCSGSPADHARPRECFEARRWASAFAAVRLLRAGEHREVPYDVAHLWWETGGAAVSAYFDEYFDDRTTVASWLYMSSIFAPGGFPGTTSGIVEEAGYMGQFLQSSDRSRVAVLVTLRRLVSRGPLHRDRPFNAYRDVELAVLRAPRDMLPDVLEFGLEFLAEEQAGGRVPTGGDRERARAAIEHAVRSYEERVDSVGTGQDERIRMLVEDVLDGIGTS